jgi:hypothetical protein
LRLWKFGNDIAAGSERIRIFGFPKVYQDPNASLVASLTEKAVNGEPKTVNNKVVAIIVKHA